MGTPQFAVPILKGLIEDQRFKVIAIYTQFPKEAGRGKDLSYSPVYLIGKEYNIPIYHPFSLKKSIEEQEKLLSLGADKIVVAAYGLILPKRIVEAIPCINVHPSLLPRWRGAAPLQRTIIEGDKESAICIMEMDEGMDTGDILACEKFHLTGKEKFEEFALEIAQQSTEILKECLISYNTIVPQKQSEIGVTYAKKIEKSEGLINWQEDSLIIERKCRGLSPFPGIYFEYKGERIKILEAIVDESDHEYIPGTIIDNLFGIACGKGILRPVIIQRSGKKPMLVNEFIKGFKVELGTKLF
jgi:methionyl-tRNA formyltransferase